MGFEPERALRELRMQALARLGRLDDDLLTIHAGRGSDTADDEHDPEGATLSGEWSLRAGLHADEQAALADIDAALARWQAGRYGVCLMCGSPIPDARLEVRPTAAHCVPCAARPAR